MIEVVFFAVGLVVGAGLAVAALVGVFHKKIAETNGHLQYLATRAANAEYALNSVLARNNFIAQQEVAPSAAAGLTPSQMNERVGQWSGSAQSLQVLKDGADRV